MTDRQLIALFITVWTLIGIVIAVCLFAALGYPLHNTITGIQLPTV